MKNYSIMLKPASSLCDLRCRYCFYADVAARRSVRSFGMMQDSVLQRIMENIARSVAPGDSVFILYSFSASPSFSCTGDSAAPPWA